jgi:hypothetical protein
LDGNTASIAAWTDDGASREERGLKHRAVNETRSIPIPPALVRILRAHIQRYGTGPGGRLFRTARGRPLNDTGYGEAWQRARPKALTPAQQASSLARRPYDLRHAAVSLWLNAGVPATDVAPATASPSCSRSTPTASTGRPGPPTSGSAMPSADSATMLHDGGAGAVGRRLLGSQALAAT